MAALGLAYVQAASAHHSFAMFDLGQIRSLQGMVKDCQWAQPHVWLDVVAKDPHGNAVTVSFEGYGPNMLRRRGWSRDTLKVGEALTISYYPNRDGKPGGALRSVTLPDGTVMRSYDFAPRASGTPP
jgi:hypothetical protein